MKQNIKKLLLLCIAMISAKFNAKAQTTGINKFKTAVTSTTTDLTGSIDSIIKFLFVIAVVIGAIGGMKVYAKISNGDQDAAKSIGTWFGGILFLIVGVGVFLKTVFL